MEAAYTCGSDIYMKAAYTCGSGVYIWKQHIRMEVMCMYVEAKFCIQGTAYVNSWFLFWMRH